ncbi:MAG TPA: 50S ribosomal protein L22 [Dehalococcoidia bacterium]|nr:50S ribosomal protein L22 [Dehalococcoidia bacterium]
MEVTAVARNLRVSPRKVRLILDELKGKTIDEAIATLQFMASPHAREIAKVVHSAASNAENNHALSSRDLYVKHAYADEGLKLKRYKARSRGRVAPRLRRFSHVTIVVEEEA